MRNRLWMLLAALALATVVSCGRGAKVTPKNSADGPLLLLNGAAPASAASTATGPVADNSRCHVCHMNYATEDLAVKHAQANIGCERCHGKSDRHCGDEDNITPPDIMYPKDKINTSCEACHPNDKLGSQHTPFLQGITKEKYCTDCHGKHRLAHRTRRWDRQTRKLIQDDKVRMLKTDPAKQ